MVLIKQQLLFLPNEHVESNTYILTVNNIKDLAGTPNIIASNSTVSYKFVDQLVISNLTVNSSQIYEIVENGLQPGATVYIDKGTVYGSIHAIMKNATYIKTANGDKGNKNPSFLTFGVNQDVTLYIAHDDRITTKPSWLMPFIDTGYNLVTTDNTFSIFTKDYFGRTITLGGNEGKGRKSMYSVIAVKYNGGDSGCTDIDADGWCIEEGDCNDNNSEIYPGAVEICDGSDNNCNGVIDDGCNGCTDIDGDGWCIEEGDCDDNDASVHPGKNDRRGKWGRNNIDNDCNGIIDG